MLFCMLWLIPPFILLSMIESKQLHYLLPLLPPLAIVIAHSLATESNPGTKHYRFVAIFYIFLALAFLTMFVLQYHIKQSGWIYEVPYWWTPVALLSGVLLITGKIYHKYPVALPAITTLIIIFSFYICTLLATRPFTSIDHVSKILADLQEKNIPVAHIGSHREQFEFPGRLKKPLDKVERDNVTAWAKDHPDGYVIARVGKSDYLNVQPHIIYRQPYRFRQQLILISSEGVVARNTGYFPRSSSGHAGKLDR